MIEQISNSVKFLAFFTSNKQGKTALTVTVDVYAPSGTQIVTDAAATAIGGGLYSYTLTSNNSTEGEYAAIFKTSDSTVDAQHIPSLWVLGRAGIENLDAATSSRLAASSYTAPTTPPTAAQNASAVRTELATELARVDVAVSTRLAPSGTLARVTLVDTATTLTNAPTVPTPAQIRSEIDSNSTQLAAIKAKTDALPASPAATGDIPSAANNASAVWAANSRTITGGTVDTLTNAPTVPSAAAIATQVWAVADKTGYSLTSAERSAIAAAVEASILNEGDGQAILNAIVAAIGNSNVDQVALVAAIRSDLERNGGKLDSIPTTAAPTAAQNATAVWSAATRSITGGTVDTLTNAPTVPTPSAIASQVRTELQNELARIDQPISTRATPANIPASDIAAIKAKTDALNTDRLAQVATTQIVGTLIAQANS